ncbi:hypothetical protein V6N13_082451 [Hibiscus sabdariffa]
MNDEEGRRISSMVTLLSLHLRLLGESGSLKKAAILLNQIQLPHHAIEDEVKEASPLKKFASLPHHLEQLTKSASVTSATVKTNESKEFSNGKNKSALMQEGKEAIKANMKRNIENPFELKRLSLGGPDPHHHS